MSLLRLHPSGALALALTTLGMVCPASAADPAELARNPPAPASDTRTYRLSPNDVLKVKVYQEDDLTTELRLSKDGTATFPLLGVVSLGGKSVEEATATLREHLAKDYLVNPQVTINVVEYAKRRFMVLGQVGKPGSYDIPSEESVTLLQAIAMAGGFTRLANHSKVTITRTLAGKKTLTVDVKSATSDPNTKPFEIVADDTITVHERVF